MRAGLGTAAILMLVSGAPGRAISSEADTGTRDAITQYGVTWTLATRVPAGRFVSGDW